jgi:hypothetical protein
VHSVRRPPLLTIIHLIRIILHIAQRSENATNNDNRTTTTLEFLGKRRNAIIMMMKLSTASLFLLSCLVTDAFQGIMLPSPHRSTTTLFVTPTQLKLLRKQVTKRRASKTLPQVWLPEDSADDSFSQTALADISTTFSPEHELVSVRGISKGAPKKVHAVSVDLAFELGLLLGTSVELIETAGHASTFYCPSTNDEEGKSITLRTSYKEGQWSKKPKAPRDHRGQIVL